MSEQTEALFRSCGTVRSKILVDTSARCCPPSFAAPSTPTGKLPQPPLFLHLRATRSSKDLKYFPGRWDDFFCLHWHHCSLERSSKRRRRKSLKVWRKRDSNSHLTTSTTPWNQLPLSHNPVNAGQSISFGEKRLLLMILLIKNIF